MEAGPYRRVRLFYLAAFFFVAGFFAVALPAAAEGLAVAFLAFAIVCLAAGFFFVEVPDVPADFPMGLWWAICATFVNVYCRTSRDRNTARSTAVRSQAARTTHASAWPIRRNSIGSTGTSSQSASHRM